MSSNVTVGEIGISVGAGHYFGDINPNMGLQRPGVAFGLFYKKQFGDYVALRFQGQFTDLAYSDARSKNSVQRQRNLSFNSDVYSVALRGDFNFFRFVPGSNQYFFTPFVSIGVGRFWYNPYAYVPGKSSPVFLQTLNLENASISDYGSNAMIYPIGFGFKYNLRQNINIGFELTHNITSTDYLDDVSGVYRDPSSLSGDALYLHDPSDPSRPYGQKGKMRGFGSKLNDTYVTAEVTLSISLRSYKCPTVY